VDATIQATRETIEQTKKLKQGLMQEFLTRGIGHTRFKQTEIGEIPEEWEVVHLGEITKKIADRNHTTPKYRDSGVIMVSPKYFSGEEGIQFDLCPFISREDHEENCKKTDASPGDIILHRIGAGLGRTRMVEPGMPEFSILHSLALIRPKHQVVLPYYLLWALRTPASLHQMGQGIQSIGVPDLGLKKVASILIALPPIAEQERLLQPIQAISEMLCSHEDYLSTLGVLKNGLMQDLLTGKVRVVV